MAETAGWKDEKETVKREEGGIKGSRVVSMRKLTLKKSMSRKNLTRDLATRTRRRRRRRRGI